MIPDLIRDVAFEIKLDTLHNSRGIKRALTVCLYSWAAFAIALTLATVVNIFG